MKLFLIIVATITILLAIAELGLRVVFGLGTPPLYIRDSEIGYLLAPNQNLTRKGNKITINQYSMRNSSISPQRPDGTLRIMLLGDSVVNGAWWTDQNDTLSVLLENQVQERKQNFTGVEVLNISANSWNPRNELAYVRRFGLWESQVLILIINTDDLFGAAPTSHKVGCDRNYPDRNPSLALIELYQKFQTQQHIINNTPTEKDPVTLNLQAIQEMYTIAQKNNIKFILGITPLFREIKDGQSRDYEQKARNRLQQLTEEHYITYIDFLPIFQEFPQPELLYRDHIHPSHQGNLAIANILASYLP